MPFDIPSVIAGELGATTTSWKTRLREAAYTSPTGTRIKFDYESVSREVDKRTASFDFPGVNDAYVQDNGFGARRYPLLCYFWGDHHDRIANAFEAALLEPGPGRLEHPLYGAFNAIPFGTITRRDDLKNAANQSVIEVTFWTTTGAVYPSAQGSPRNEILAALDGFDVEVAQQFAEKTNLASAVAKANLQNTIRKQLRTISASLQQVADTTSDVNRKFREIQQSVNYGLDVLIGQPLQLAQQMSNLVKAPGRALLGIASRLDAYEQLARKILASAAASGTQVIPGLPGTSVVQLSSLRLRESNDFHASDLVALNAVGGSVLSAVETTYSSRPEALGAAEAVLAQLDEVVAWRESRFDTIEQVDPGASYQAMQQAVALVAGFLIQSSSTLTVERRIVLDRPRTIIDLAAELYGSVDDRLDEMINTNALTGQEILELPRGRIISYFP